jgi:hypothetical protein
MLLRNKKPVPDTMLNYFAALDDYRYDLYYDLKQSNLVSLFPASYNNHVELAKSRIMKMTSSYNRPDTLVFVERLPVQQKERSGFVYFFKYKQKKDDNNWKLATVGIVPADPKTFEFEKKGTYFEELQYDFTELNAAKIEEEEPIKEQIKKTLKKMLYSKRNSASEFYRYDDSNGGYDFLNMGFRD